MLELDDHAEGTVLSVRARAGARRNGITGEHAGSLQVSVTQAPEKGKANKAIIAVLAKALDIRKSQIELISGATSPQKRFLIRAASLATIRVRVEDALRDC